MAIRNASTRTTLAAAYATANPYGSVFTGDPGTADAATNEVTGGSPAFARKSASWGTAAASVVTTTSAPAFDIPASTTVTYFGVCRTVTAAAATVGDSTTVTSQTFSSQGVYTVTPTYTQS